jgi:type II secretory pathway pseudopilin PulG
MAELSIALVIIAILAFYLVNKYLDQQHAINTRSAEAEISAAIEQALTRFDDRINNTWGTISEVKQELNAIKLQISMKRINQ